MIAELSEVELVAEEGAFLGGVVPVEEVEGSHLYLRAL